LFPKPEIMASPAAAIRLQAEVLPDAFDAVLGSRSRFSSCAGISFPKRSLEASTTSPDECRLPAKLGDFSTKLAAVRLVQKAGSRGLRNPVDSSPP